MTPTLSELCSQYDEISQTKGFGNGVKNAKRFATRAFEELGTDRVEKKDLFDGQEGGLQCGTEVHGRGVHTV